MRAPRELLAALLPHRLALQGINRMLRAESWARATLLPFAGKSARLVMQPLDVVVTITAEGLVEWAAPNAHSAVTIELPLGKLADVGMAPEKASAHVRLEGDADFAQALALVARHLRPDVEEELARVLGDVMAVRIVALMQAGVKTVKSAHQRAAENAAEYLLEENPQLVRPRDVEEFSAAVRKLRDDLARLEKRIGYLAGQS
jgi:ubiquinone biosynthesis protein UbiJ